MTALMRPACEARAAASPGFTLLELTVVLFIMALVAALAAPNFSGRWQEMQLRRAVREVAADLRQARTHAMRTQVEAVVTIDLANRRLTSTASGRARALPADLTIDVIAAGSETTDRRVSGVRFYPDGSATGGRVRFATSRTRLSVDVNWLTGRVSILDDERT
jgi:general secretion pathway protein H